MHLSENEGIEEKVFVVTGGLGFVGSNLCLELARRGAREVRSLDVRASSPWLPHLLNTRVRCIQGDVSKKEDVDEAFEGADCVFHLASFGMSGKEMLQAGRVDEVNIHGTCNVLNACQKFGIRRLVYASTYNVVFGGKEIINGNESLPYFPIDSHIDPYGRSKSVAEQLVLKSNARTSKNKQRLYTCAVRPAAIYGPGEERHLPRIAFLAKMGLLSFKIGEENVKTDWVFVDNLVLSLILASMGLLDDIPGRKGCPVAAGQAYFISDGFPVNSFEFLVKPLVQSLDLELPKRTLPVQTALFVANFFWILYSMLYPWLNKRWLPQPFLLPSEVHKICVTHYFSLLKAKEELGYVPLVSPKDGLASTISYWRERKKSEFDGPTIYAWLFVVIGMLMMFCTACLPPYGPLRYIHNIALFVFRSEVLVCIVFGIAVVLHVGEAIYAYYLAKRVDPPHAEGWFWQTAALGIFSLRYLLRRA